MTKLAILGILFAVSAHAEVLEVGSTNRQYADVKAFVAKLATDHRDTVTTFDIGNSDSGEKIVGVKIGNGPIHNLVVSTHHGNEYGSTEVALGFADSVAKTPIEGQTIYVIPVLNITGYNARNREERDTKGNSWDPNRNYPGPCATEGPFTLKSTKALADFVAKENIVASATLHTFSPAVVYPWGISTRDLDTAYPNEFKKLVADATVESHYETGNSTQVIYAADGTYEDYAFQTHGIWSILFELGNSHSPSEGDVQRMVQLNVPGMRRMFENAPVTRAANHTFAGKCDRRLASFDRHDE